MGTSTCDIVVGTYEEVGSRTVHGICGQVDGSVLPGYIGFEAGQAAFGDLYAWFRRVMAWPLRQIAKSDPQLEERILGELTAEAERLPLTDQDPVALDWHNGRRTPDADPRVRGALDGLTLAEIGTVCGCSKVSVYESIDAVRKKFLKFFANYPNE